MKFSGLIILTLFFYCANSQQPFNAVNNPSGQQSGSIVNQVNQFTGKLGLSVPIYSYASPSSGLKLSVSIDYSSGGLNLNQDPSCVGTGWNLSAGGFIHRDINGKPDDIQLYTPGGYNVSGFMYTPNISTPPCGFQYRSLGYYPNAENKVNQDSEPDDFRFSFLGKTGSFNIPKGGHYVNGPAVVTKPYSNLKFSFILGNKPWPIVTDITEIIVTDDNGIEYTFSGIQTSGKMQPVASQESSGQPYYYYHNDYQRVWEDYITDWLLTKVRDKNSSEEITLTYEDYYGKSKFPTSITAYTCQGYFYYKEFKDDRNIEYWGDAKRVKTITLANNDNVIFDYDTNDRCDWYNNKALKNIKVKNGDNETNFSFNYVYYKGNSEISYNGCTSATDQERLSKWLFLKSVNKSINSKTAPIASFEYIQSSDKIPSATDNNFPSRKTIWAGYRGGIWGTGWSSHQTIQDAYGFYSGGETPSGPLATCNMIDNYWKMVNFCDLPKIGYPEIGSLKKINYPTGGSMSVEYEGNTILKNNNDLLSYGVRVKKVIQNDGISSANDITKEYKYIRADGKSSGFTLSIPPHTYTVEEKTVQNNILQTVVASTATMASPATINGSAVGYSRIEEITSLGKSVSEYTDLTDFPALYSTYTFPFANKQRVADWAYGLLKKQSIFDLNGNVVRTSENTYNVVISPVSTPEYKSMKTAYLRETNQSVFGQSYDPVQCAQTDAYWQFTYDTYYPISGKAELLSTTEKNFLKDGSIVSNKVDYEYDQSTQNVKKISTTNSLNEKLDKIIFYPTDFVNSADKNYLVLKGITSKPVSSISILTKPNGDKYIAGLERTDFKYAPDISVRPEKLVTMKSKNLVQIASNKTTFTPEENYGDATLKSTTDVIFDIYDSHGNAVQTTGKYVTQSSIWDNEQKIIVAKSNAAFDDIAFTSFETNEKGNWNYTLVTPLYDYNAPTGKKVYKLMSGYQFLSKNNLSPSKTYWLSYWSNSGPYLVNNTSTPIVSGTTVNGWTYYKHEFSGVSDVSILGNGLIDEVRLHPSDSRMTSATYEPLVGVSSESGIDGQITKYTYDSFGRLLNIKDEKGNISKVYCYNSQGLPSDCGDAPVYHNWSIPPYTSFTLYNRNCPAGTISNPIQYDVPEGRYISFISQQDADDQAARDAATFGQTIADATSSACVSMTIYAKISYENVVWGSGYSYGDVVVHFYSDQAGTQPVNVINLNVNYNEVLYYPYYGYQYTNPYSKVVSGSSSTLATGVYFTYETVECDYGYWPCYTYTNTDDYELSSSSNYQIIY